MEFARYQKIYADALSFYEFILKRGSGSKKAKNYLDSRQFSDEMLDKWNIGYAPKYPAALCHHLLKRGVTEQELIEANLGFVNDRKMLVDRFKDRIIFPIRDADNNIYGFGGRAIGENYKAKYLNTAANDYFDKSSLFYGLDNAQEDIKRTKQAVICEGYTDVIAMHNAGCKCAVATMGTAFTKRHAIKLLGLGVNRVTFMFDGDKAGIKAAVKAIKAAPLFYQMGIDCRVVVLPDNKDPFEYLSENSVDDLRNEFRQGKDLLEFCLEHEWENNYFRSGIYTPTANAVTACLSIVKDLYKNGCPVEFHKGLEWVADKAEGLGYDLNTLYQSVVREAEVELKDNKKEFKRVDSPKVESQTNRAMDRAKSVSEASQDARKDNVEKTMAEVR